MKIGIVTVYESVTNLGSYLQAYALKTILEDWGHDVFLIQKTPMIETVRKCVCKVNPKREFFLRFHKAGKFVKAMRKIKLVSKNKVQEMDFDCLIYGSDEIWNLENPYFRDELFWGTNISYIPKIAYAISMGSMTRETLELYGQFVTGVLDFKEIYVRDFHTKRILENFVQKQCSFTCDPTFLLPISRLSSNIRLPRKKYIFVYTYGVSHSVEKVIREFAKKENLIIVSACFWHPWVDKVIECLPLEFSTIIRGAECVFTSTFHGAVFTMLNHKRCCILPTREKVRDVVERLQEQEHLIEENCSLDEFTKIMSREFDGDAFEERLKVYREESILQLKGVLECLEN